MLLAYKYRIYPNCLQKEQIHQHFGCCRWVYNWFLSERKKHYEDTGKTLSKRTLQDKLVREEKINNKWLNDVNSQSLLATLVHAQSAYSKFFSRQGGYPKYKSKRHGWQSYQCPQHVQVDFEAQKIKLPKIDGLKIKLHRSFVGIIKTCTVKKSPSGKYYVSILVDNQETQKARQDITAGATLGIDLGIKDFAVMSDGSKIANPKYLSKSLSKLQDLSKQLSRKRKSSNNKIKWREVLP